MEVVAGHRGKRVRPSVSPSTPVADPPALDCERERRSRGAVLGVRAAAAPGRAAALATRVVAVLRARRRAQGRGLPLRQRGRLRQRRDRVDVHAAGHHDRGRARRTRDLPRRRHRRGELPPALRPQRPERPDPAGGADLRAESRVGFGARAQLHRRGVDRRAGHLLRDPGRGIRGGARAEGHLRRLGTRPVISRSCSMPQMGRSSSRVRRCNRERNGRVHPNASESGASSARDPRYPGSVDRLRSLAPVRVHFAHDAAVWER